MTSMLLFGDAKSPSNGFYEAFGAERLYSSSGEFHVNSENVASYTMLLDLGATKAETDIGWLLLEWPDGSCPYSV